MRKELIILLILLVSAAGFPSRPHAAEIRIGLIECQAKPLGDPFIKSFNSNIEDHCTAPITIENLPYNYQETMKSIGSFHERHAKMLLEESNCSYLIYLRKRRTNDLWFIVWDKNGEKMSIAVPGGMNIENQLTDTAVNSFLSILYNMNSNLQNARLY